MNFPMNNLGVKESNVARWELKDSKPQFGMKGRFHTFLVVNSEERRIRFCDTS
jgi:hypothetical protein